MFSRFAKPEQIKKEKKNKPKSADELESWKKMLEEVEKLIGATSIHSVTHHVCEIVHDRNHPIIKISGIAVANPKPDPNEEKKKSEMPESHVQYAEDPNCWAAYEQRSEMYEADMKACANENVVKPEFTDLMFPGFDTNDEEWARQRQEQQFDMRKAMRRMNMCLQDTDTMMDEEQEGGEGNPDEQEENAEDHHEECFYSGGPPPTQLYYEEPEVEHVDAGYFNEWNFDVEIEEDSEEEIAQVQMLEEIDVDAPEPEPDEHFNRIALELEQQMAEHLVNKMMGTTEDPGHFIEDTEENMIITNRDYSEMYEQN